MLISNHKVNERAYTDAYIHKQVHILTISWKTNIEQNE